MQSEIIVAVIGLIGVIITVLASSHSTQNKIDTENQVQNQKIDRIASDIQTVKAELTEKIDNNHALTETKITHINENLNSVKIDIKEHNHYAQLFSETLPVVQEKQSVANHRITTLEEEFKTLRNSVK